MKEHYDLVILGATPEGLYAAQQALKIKGKRVALVTQGINPETSLASTYFYAYLQQFLTQQTQLKLWQSFQPDFPGSLNPQDLIRVSQELSELAVQQDSRLDDVSIQGLDIIDAKGAFLHPTKRKKAVFEVENRLLRSRFYLLTLPSREVNLETFFQGNNYRLMGASPTALTWAYFLAKLGKNVTVITHHADILPDEEPSISRLLHAYLESLKIQFLTEADDNNFDLMSQDAPVIAPPGMNDDQILDCRRPSLPIDWGFDKLNLRQEPTGIWVNTFLRASHPQIYAIGGAIAGYSSLELAQQEADCVLQNTLLGHKKPVNYAQFGYSLLTYPYLGRWGLTTAQARQYYGDRISVTTHWLHLPSTILGDDWGSGYHYIWKDDQQLVGAYYWGDRTRDFVQWRSSLDLRNGKEFNDNFR